MTHIERACAHVIVTGMVLISFSSGRAERLGEKLKWEFILTAEMIKSWRMKTNNPSRSLKGRNDGAGDR